jgi:hypothetical protein
MSAEVVMVIGILHQQLGKSLDYQYNCFEVVAIGVTINCNENIIKIIGEGCV